MSNFYNNNNYNIDNFLNYDSMYKNNFSNLFYQHICFASIFLFIIIYLIYDYFRCKKKSNIVKKKKRACTSCQYNNHFGKNDKNIKNTQKEENNNLILKYETENFKEVFNKSSSPSSS